MGCAIVEEIATLASLALFVGMVAIWAQVIATLWLTMAAMNFVASGWDRLCCDDQLKLVTAAAQPLAVEKQATMTQALNWQPPTVKPHCPTCARGRLGFYAPSVDRRIIWTAATGMDAPDEADLGEIIFAPERFRLLQEVLQLHQISQQCAKDAVPYVHPRLASVEHGGNQGRALEARPCIGKKLGFFLRSGLCHENVNLSQRSRHV
jgi:hypothetical protein